MRKGILIHQVVDDGTPLQLLDPTGAGGIDGFAISAAACDNPKCSCTSMRLLIEAIRFDEHGIGQLQGTPLGGEVSSDGNSLQLDSARCDTFTDDVVAWLHARLSDPEQRARLAERWRRLRGQIGDPAYPSPLAPSRTDLLVPFNDVFPCDFDLTVVHDHRKYLALDQYCLEPRCTCDDVHVQFFDWMADPAPYIGYAMASIRRLPHADFHGEPEVRQLWAALLEQLGPTTLRDRFTRAREVATRRPVPTLLNTPARKALCPCGSGKKYKRCCGK